MKPPTSSVITFFAFSTWPYNCRTSGSSVHVMMSEFPTENLGPKTLVRPAVFWGGALAALGRMGFVHVCSILRVVCATQAEQEPWKGGKDSITVLALGWSNQEMAMWLPFALSIRQLLEWLQAGRPAKITLIANKLDLSFFFFRVSQSEFQLFECRDSDISRFVNHIACSTP